MDALCEKKEELWRIQQEYCTNLAERKPCSHNGRIIVASSSCVVLIFVACSPKQACGQSCWRNGLIDWLIDWFTLRLSRQAEPDMQLCYTVILQFIISWISASLIWSFVVSSVVLSSYVTVSFLFDDLISQNLHFYEQSLLELLILVTKSTVTRKNLNRVSCSSWLSYLQVSAERESFF